MEVEVGQIVNTHGIKGSKGEINSDFTETRFQPGEQLLVNIIILKLFIRSLLIVYIKDFTC